MEQKRKGRVRSAVSQHVHMDRSEHGVSLDRVKILTVENKKFERGVKEAIYILVAKPSLKNDGGHYLLPTVWTNLLRASVCPPPSPMTAINIEVPHLAPQHHYGVKFNLSKATVNVERLVK